MGSKSSNIRSDSIDIKRYAKWRDDSGCDCDDTKKKVYLIKLNDVPMMSSRNQIQAYYGRALVGVFTFAASEACIFKGHRLTHDVIEARVKCQCEGCMKNGCLAKNGKICGSNPYYTLEYTNSGSSMNIGYYSKTLYEDKEYRPTNMNLNNLKEIYDLYEEVDGRNYSFVNFNCKDWAKRVYNRIENDY